MTASLSLAALPLPVGIFRAAMQQQLPLNAYAATLNIGGDELCALITAQVDQVAPETLARVAAAQGQRADQGQPVLVPVLAEEPFSAWLERQMEGVTQASLRARTQLAAPQLRAFLSGKALPDADAAERLARALYVDRTEMARSIVADMTRRARSGGSAPARRGPSPDEGAATGDISAPAPTPAAPAPVRPRRKRRQEPGALDKADTPAVTTAALASEPEAPMPPTAADAATAGADSPPEIPAEVPPATGRGRSRSPRAAALTDLPSTAPSETSAPAQADDDPASTRTGRRRAGKAGVPAPTGTMADAAPGTAPDAATMTAGQDASVVADETSEAHSPGAAEDAASSAQSGVAALAGAAMEVTPTGQPVASPTLAAQVTPTMTTLLLAPEEARLIRLWRRMHPQGRRATLQYIGSLLVEEDGDRATA